MNELREQPKNACSMANNFSMPSVEELKQMTVICETLAKCQHYQKLGPGGVLAIYLAAKEMNLPFMMCLNGGMYTFSGRISLSAQLMNMMLVKAGHQANVKQLDEQKCTIEFKRFDRPEGDNTFIYTYDMGMATKAGYANKEPWKNHPRDMLFARCLSGGARKYMPDALMNAYVVGEIDEEEERTQAVSGLIDIKEEVALVSKEQAEAIEKEFADEPERMIRALKWKNISSWDQLPATEYEPTMTRILDSKSRKKE